MKRFFSYCRNLLIVKQCVRYFKFECPPHNYIMEYTKKCIVKFQFAFKLEKPGETNSKATCTYNYVNYVKTFLFYLNSIFP